MTVMMLVLENEAKRVVGFSAASYRRPSTATGTVIKVFIPSYKEIKKDIQHYKNDAYLEG